MISDTSAELHGNTIVADLSYPDFDCAGVRTTSSLITAAGPSLRLSAWGKSVTTVSSCGSADVSDIILMSFERYVL